MATNGNNIIILRDGEAIASTKSDDFQTACEIIPTSSPTDGEWQTGIAGRKSWSLAVGFLVGSDASFTEALNVGTTYMLTIMNRGRGNFMQGDAIMTQCRITATRGTLVQGSFQFQGIGGLSHGTSGRILDE